MSNKTQYIRLLAEINAAGLTTQQITDLEKSMDNNKEFIDEILNSAEKDFDLLKQKSMQSNFNPVGTTITKEEANQIVIDKTGIVTGGGYTLLPGFYCAMGSIPGCLRGGNHSGINEKIEDWYKLNLRDLIICNSFYPCPFTIGILVELQSNFNDYSINIDDMVKFCIEGPYSAEQLKHDGDFGNSTIWINYFKEKDNEAAKQKSDHSGESEHTD